MSHQISIQFEYWYVVKVYEKEQYLMYMEKHFKTNLALFQNSYHLISLIGLLGVCDLCLLHMLAMCFWLGSVLAILM